MTKSIQKPTHYCIVANPASGGLPANKRHALLNQAAEILQAEIHGLDTGCAEELVQCAKKQAERCDVMVIAGGDGTFSLVINAIDLSATALAFLPFGTGNALTHALHYRGNLLSIAGRVRNGSIHAYDLVDCDGRKKAFMASLGLDGAAIRLYEHYRSIGYRGLNAHLRAGIKAFFKEYRPTSGLIAVDGDIRRVKNLLSLMVVKQPFFGMGLKAVPRAKWNDANLHAMQITSGLPGLSAGLMTGFTIGNRVGQYRCGKNIKVWLDAPLTIQIDGDLGWTSDRFTFAVLPGLMRLKH